MSERHDAGAADFDTGYWVECWQCSGIGDLAGCFEDTCCGADCDPDDAEYCCAPRRCDICHGRGGWTDPKHQERSKALTGGQR